MLIVCYDVLYVEAFSRRLMPSSSFSSPSPWLFLGHGGDEDEGDGVIDFKDG